MPKEVKEFDFLARLTERHRQVLKRIIDDTREELLKNPSAKNVQKEDNSLSSQKNNSTKAT